MIAEDYVSFETAKLLKEKGFDVPTEYFFNTDGLCCQGANSYNWNDDKDVDDGCEDYSRPSIYVAMKWLREVHHFFIGCEPRLSFTDFYWITANIYKVRKKPSLYHVEDVDDYHCVAGCDSHSYEEACEMFENKES